MRQIPLKNKKLDSDKAISYGFILKDENYLLKKSLPSFPFTAVLSIKEDILESQLMDNSFGEEYTLVDRENAFGYSSQVKEEYEALLKDVLSSCFETKTSQKDRILSYVLSHYGDKEEYLWEKFSDTCIVRKKTNEKWYLCFMNVDASKLGLNSKENLSVLDLRGTPERMSSLDHIHFFPGFHMNKKHWYSIILDKGVEDSLIFSLIEESYLLAK